MVRFRTLPVLLLATAMSACATGARGPGPRPIEPTTATSTSPTASPWPVPSPIPEGVPRYEADALVVDGPDGPAMLCVGDVASITPPPCGTVPITNWDWDLVDGEEQEAGATWGYYYVAGAYDGSAFTVLEAGATRPLAEDPAYAIDRTASTRT